MIRLVSLVAAAALVLAGCTDSDTPPPDPASAPRSAVGTADCDPAVDRALTAWERAGFSGSVAMLREGRFTCVAGYGRADRGARVPNTPGTVFSIGSISKAVTAAAVFALVDDGRLSLTVIALGPIAAGLAWWWAGRAVRPIERVRAVAEDIEGSDLGRRIDLDHGPTEVVSLAASFDAMLDRLERAAETQRRLVEETSHELRTPLAILATNADVLLAHPEPTVELYREGLQRSKAAATRLSATIDELLVDARGRARTLDRQPADLVAVARDVVDDVRLVAEPREVEVTLAGPESAVCALDEAAVRRAIANLVDNAVRHAPPGSAVDVDIMVTDREASLVVTDHGPGLRPEEQEHVFERFWRGGSDGPGTGLGLPIARQIALGHGGDVVVNFPGRAGDGCAVRLTLRR